MKTLKDQYDRGNINQLYIIQIKRIVEHCWDEDEKQRPDFIMLKEHIYLFKR